MARKLKQLRFQNLSACKGDCSGHNAGYNYANGGGSTPSPYSGSFNNGMRIALGTFVKPKRKRRTRKSP
jgi:hypothetical protein